MFRKLVSSAPKLSVVLAGLTLSTGGGVILGQYAPNLWGPQKPHFGESTLPLSKLSNPEYASFNQTRSAISRIRNIVGEDNINTVSSEVKAHCDSAFQYRHPSPGEYSAAVAYPKSTEEVSQILKICQELRVPLTPYSGGTSLEGHYIPVYQGITLDLSRMNRVLEFNPKDMDIVVQPGVTWEEINEIANPAGLRFGPDPGPSAMIGGMVGTNASGTNSLAMGTMRQNVIGLKVVLADGTLIRTRRRPRKSSAGYGLTDLFIGSEGTLGVVVEATLRLHAQPAFTKIGALSFPTIRKAADLVESVLQTGLQIDAMELMDDEQMRLINTSGLTSRKWDENSTLLVRFAGHSKEYVDREIAAISKLSKSHSAISMVFAKNEEEGAELWAARKNALFSVLQSAPNGYRCMGTDTAVPISQLSRFVEESQEKIKEFGLMGSVLGHVGDGNFHVCIAYNPASDELKKAHAFAEWCAHRSVELEGTCTGEHGIGMGKRLKLVDELGQPAIDLMRQIKYALDPHFIMNPGKVFSIQPFNDNGDNPVKPHEIDNVS